MDLREHLEQMRRGLEERRRALQDDLNELAAREFTGQDGDGCVRVTVDGRGAVRGVKVDPKRFRTIKGDELGRRVVEAVRAARSASAKGAGDALKRLSGDDTEALQRLRDTLTRDRE
ncbi:MAG: hypothetical protein GEV03_12675 [Streptosporangiales bacterium]|nr:hypothetical protein [Streptosporangiales bacterium]